MFTKEQEDMIARSLLNESKKLRVFDFDDTLAHTVSTIGVRRLLSDGSEDPEFEDFLLDNNIQYVRMDRGFWWLDSANFALFEAKTMSLFS